MKFKSYMQSWEGTQNENKWSRIFIVGLIAAVVVLSLMLTSKKTIVTIQPFTLKNEAWVTEANASQSYKEAWGFALAQLLGNVTPTNVDFIKERLAGLLSPKIYSDVMSAIDVQAQEIRLDRVTIRFEPRFVEYEKDSEKVFVYGTSFTKGLSKDSEISTDRTYEFDIAVSNYIPVVDFIDTYKGRPRTEKVLERLRSRNQIENE
ncbi:type IV conjugative transfer system protein TraE [Marinomonas algarum]|uniref:Type IV conjugative transfer system protein TraE n=1 Tax=Marinomonas algarum TaxID=2883105 RepID=A0A9X1LF82_9GAMM|nr:type IV conjugative transfer system protein TraE [Marinomonas algarum]MCB5162643.1 type IV conjugative transfer system protein TraE [Marinomonas algarum]